jgi:hypothetical protein
MPADETPEPTEACPGCGAVLVRVPEGGPSHAGASASCSRLFEVTLRGLREEISTEPATAATVRLADAAYDAQHPAPGDRSAVVAALTRLSRALKEDPPSPGAAVPQAWRTTVADVAADLDVIDLAVLVETWARAVHGDWCAAAATRS